MYRCDPVFCSVVVDAFTSLWAGSRSGIFPAKPEPPCKSGQLKKDLGLEMSSARHAARLIISEFIRSFFVGSNGSSPKWNLKIDGHPCQSEALSRGEQASVPLIRYWLTSTGEDSPGKEGFQLADDRRRQFRFQEIKHHEHRLLGVLLGDPCSLYNEVYYLFVHGELSARA